MRPRRTVPTTSTSPWELARRTYAEGRDDIEMVLLGAFDGDEMWGAARVDVNRYDNLRARLRDLLHAPRPAAARASGRALAEASYDVARARGCTQLLTEAYAPLDDSSAGVLFGEAMGFDAGDRRRHEGRRPRRDRAVVGRAWRRRPRRGTRATGSSPGATGSPTSWSRTTAGSTRCSSSRRRWASSTWSRRSGTRPGCASARRTTPAPGGTTRPPGAVAPDGTLVGFTEVFTNDHAPWRGIQSGTLVDPDHRGHGLGLAIKLANHRQLREHFPQCRVLLTGNADVNAAMNAVNDALGLPRGRALRGDAATAAETGARKPGMPSEPTGP